MALSMRESSRHWQSQLRVVLVGTLVVIACLQPGVLLGAGLTAGWWRWRQPPTLGLVVLAAASTLAAVLTVGLITWGWPWRLWITWSGHGLLFPPAWRLRGAIWPQLARSVLAETAVGPAWAVGVVFIRWTQEGMPAGMIQDQRRRQAARRKKLGLEPSAPSPAQRRQQGFRLGLDAQAGALVGIKYPADIAQHATILGKIGSGKTTTSARLVEGALEQGWPVVIIDAKGFGSLRHAAARFAERFGVPFRLVAPDDPDTLKYNPCVGTPSQISNKLIGAFTFGAEAEIYKNIALEVIPVLVRALQAAATPVTLTALFNYLGPAAMVGLTRQVPETQQALRNHVLDLSDRKAPYPAAYAGMRGRFGALLQGKYGELFSLGDDGGAQACLDIAAAFAPDGGITYISLPALEAAEDVELMAWVLAQDIKQVAAARIAHRETGHALLVLDEFAGLREATQLNDLLLQAREAQVSCIVSTQFLPNLADAPALRQALLSAGMFVAHQVSPEDAEAVAGLFGTNTAVEVTSQVDYVTGTSEKGSMRHVEQYRVHPNELRDLTRGMAAVRIEPGERRIAIVRVDRPADMESPS